MQGDIHGSEQERGEWKGEGLKKTMVASAKRGRGEGEERLEERSVLTPSARRC